MTKSHEVLAAPRVPRLGPYSQAVRVGNLIFIAGQAGLDPATGAAAGSTFAMQARQAFENLKTLLEDIGSGLDEVVKTTCFITAPENFAELNTLFAEYFPAEPPVRTVPVVQLPKGFLLSIDAIAAGRP